MLKVLIDNQQRLFLWPLRICITLNRQKVKGLKLAFQGTCKGRDFHSATNNFKCPTEAWHSCCYCCLLFFSLWHLLDWKILGKNNSPFCNWFLQCWKQRSHFWERFRIFLYLSSIWVDQTYVDTGSSSSTNSSVWEIDVTKKINRALAKSFKLTLKRRLLFCYDQDQVYLGACHGQTRALMRYLGRNIKPFSPSKSEHLWGCLQPQILISLPAVWYWPPVSRVFTLTHKGMDYMISTVSSFTILFFSLKFILVGHFWIMQK